MAAASYVCVVEVYHGSVFWLEARDDSIAISVMLSELLHHSLIGYPSKVMSASLQEYDQGFRQTWEHFTDIFSINIYVTSHLHQLLTNPHYLNRKWNVFAIKDVTRTDTK